ncbi:MAG: tRNA guanosine(15) transglycosylase TgtA [Candidatus Thorarchaeota archaeon]|nr:MAG: tRNA guanosine(15) transglycosylase TgtA [Candidatus Thorarchaeota archaeon]
MSQFEIRAKDGLARLGRFETNHGTVTTPLLMPVVHPGKSEVTPSQLVSEFKFQMVITNAYIIKSTDRFRDAALDKGVHSLLNFSGPIMTDSGTFQMYTHGLPEGEIDPMDIVSFQRQIGSDVGTILDTFSDPYATWARVEQDVQVSTERARISIPVKGDMLLAGTVQGGIYPDLRIRAADEMAPLNIDVHPIGGLVPLMEQYRYADIVRATLAAKSHLPPQRPVHLFGCGHPMFFAQAVLMGCDLFDSASYAKFAESGRLLFPTGTVHLSDLRELPCECPACNSTTIDDLQRLDKAAQSLILTKHNLYVSAAEIRRVRQAIADGNLLELAALRARSHPALYEALDIFLEQIGNIESSAPSANAKSVFYTGPETARHPLLRTFQYRILERYPFRRTRMLVMVPDMGAKPFSETNQAIENEVKMRDPAEMLLFYVTPIGVVPWELEHVYPAQQTIFPASVDSECLTAAGESLTRLLSTMEFDDCMWVSRETPTNVLSAATGLSDRATKVSGVSELSQILPAASHPQLWQKRVIAGVCAFQWDVRDMDSFGLNELGITLSSSTGKIRHITRNGKVLFTLVPTNGLLTPTYDGGRLLLKSGLKDDYKVVVDDDAAPFVADGKSVMTKFVKWAGPHLMAGEEVLVVDSKGEFLGSGKAVLNGREMMAFRRGVAVIMRHSKKQPPVDYKEDDQESF